jgi:CHAT domain-containing protein
VDVGDADQAARAADALFENPDDVAAARLLGRMIVPPGSSAKTLDVLALGALAKVPLAALRDDDGGLTIARRPLARVLGLRPGAALVAARDAPVIVANSRGGLIWAVHEAAMAFSAAGNHAKWFIVGTSAPATIARLREAGRAELLHFSGHASGNGRWPALDLADGSITSKQIAEQGLAPRLAVLAVSRSAVAGNDDPFGSIAGAFLEAGTETVIATEHSIADRDSFALVSAFYSQPDWRTDPVRALARAQQAESRAVPPDPRDPRPTWAKFAAFRRPPDEREGSTR